jgi:hypothetical protein
MLLISGFNFNLRRYSLERGWWQREQEVAAAAAGTGAATGSGLGGGRGSGGSGQAAGGQGSGQGGIKRKKPSTDAQFYRRNAFKM